MRIIGGEAKGRIILLPKGYTTRPTSDKTKETLFNILHNVEGKCLLDLFAGSGNVGLEALSRRASRVVFIEKDSTLAKAIKRSICNFEFNGRGEVIAMDSGTGIRELHQRGERFDILFADPPYEKGFVKKTLQNLKDWGVVACNGIIIFQHSIREPLHEIASDHYILTDQRRSGDTTLSFLKLNPVE